MTEVLHCRDRAQVASVEAIRRHFPALERVDEHGPVAYFDGPGGTQVPRAVVDAMTDYLYHHNANTHWSYPTSAETDAAIDAARAAVADLLNAAADEMVFGNNMTTITFHVARALGRGWGPGDEVVVTELDHHANIEPWRALVRDGAHRPVGADSRRDGTARLGRPRARHHPRTRLLAIGAASNALGTITDVRPRPRSSPTTAARSCSSTPCTTPPHALIDVALSRTAISWRARRTSSTGRTSASSIARRAVLDAARRAQARAGVGRGPERLETGTQNHEGIVGTGAAVDFLASLATGARAGAPPWWKSRRPSMSAASACSSDSGTTSPPSTG